MPGVPSPWLRGKRVASEDEQAKLCANPNVATSVATCMFWIPEE